MDKVYLLRHDAIGVLDVFFTRPPTDDEIAAIQAQLARIHGVGHAKHHDPKHPSYREGHPDNGMPWRVHVEDRPVVDGYTDYATALAANKQAPRRTTIDTGATGGASGKIGPKITAATGVVTPPPDLEAVSITAADVGTLKV